MVYTIVFSLCYKVKGLRCAFQYKVKGLRCAFQYKNLAFYETTTGMAVRYHSLQQYNTHKASLFMKEEQKCNISIFTREIQKLEPARQKKSSCRYTSITLCDKKKKALIVFRMHLKCSSTTKRTE
jgi:hypothetical protein